MDIWIVKLFNTFSDFFAILVSFIGDFLHAATNILADISSFVLALGGLVPDFCYSYVIASLGIFVSGWCIKILFEVL